MKWNRTLIAEWHRQALPKCDVASQRIKLDKECEEFYFAKAMPDKLEEIADVYIVAAALWMRYHDFAGRFVADRLEKSKSWPKISEAVDCKMDINACRKYELINGEWRHVDEF